MVNYPNILPNCRSQISISTKTFGLCADTLNWQYYYSIDINNDGNVEVEMEPFSKLQYQNKELYISKNKYANNPNQPFDASGNYPLGIHHLIFTIDDQCGKIITSEKTFEVVDCAAPTIAVYDYTPTFNLTNCSVKLKTSDIIKFYLDNCDENNMIAYFNNNSLEDTIVLNAGLLGPSTQCHNYKINIAKYLTLEDQKHNKQKDIPIYLEDFEHKCPIGLPCHQIKVVTPEGKLIKGCDTHIYCSQDKTSTETS